MIVNIDSLNKHMKDATRRQVFKCVKYCVKHEKKGVRLTIQNEGSETSMLYNDPRFPVEITITDNAGKRLKKVRYPKL